MAGFAFSAENVTDCTPVYIVFMVLKLLTLLGLTPHCDRNSSRRALAFCMSSFI